MIIVSAVLILLFYVRCRIWCYIHCCRFYEISYMFSNTRICRFVLKIINFRFSSQMDIQTAYTKFGVAIIEGFTKIVKVECNQACLKLPRRILSSLLGAKITKYISVPLHIIRRGNQNIVISCLSITKNTNNIPLCFITFVTNIRLYV